MEKVFAIKKIRNLELINSLVFPPMVCFKFSQGDGMVSDEHLIHYQKLAQNGIGLIIVEATAVSPNGRLSIDQLGLWKDQQIEGFRKITDIIHKTKTKTFLQIHHAGLKSIADLASASSYEGPKGRARALEISEIKAIIRDFVKTAKRAEEAGFDGVEIHGAHGYLLTQFFSEKVNHRNDNYGGNFENRNRIATEIYNNIRAQVGKNFVIGIRMGFNENSLAESIERAKFFEDLGMDYLSISTGFDNSPITQQIPANFPGNWIVHGAKLIKDKVKIPVIGVNLIKEKEQIKRLINENYLDFAAIGRAQLADYNFTKHLKNEEEILVCLNCKPCRWSSDGRKCPRYKINYASKN